MTIGNVAIVGYGQQGQECFDLIKDSVPVAAIVDPRLIGVGADKSLAEKLQKSSFRGDVYPDVDCLLNIGKFDAAIVCVPHAVHTDITLKLMAKGKPVIKEKPFAPELNQADQILRAYHATGVPVLTICQRSSSQLFKAAASLVCNLEKPYAFVYQYFLSQPSTTGWRQKRDMALGGVLLDMGYHIVDVTRGFFGVPDVVTSAHAYATPAMHAEGLEDYVSVQMLYKKPGIVGTILLGRHYHSKREHFEIFGSKGSLVVEPKKSLSFSDLSSGKGELIGDVEQGKDLYKKQVLEFLSKIEDIPFVANHVAQHYANTKIIDRIYESGLGQQSRPVFCPQSTIPFSSARP